MDKITFYNEEKFMYITSNLFIIPTLYGYYNDYNYLSLFNLFSTLITTKFWHTGKNNIYRKIDLVYQPFHASLFFMYGNMNCRNIYLLSLGNLFFLNGLCFYRKSYIEHKKYNRFWYFNHLIFHLSMIISNIITYSS